MKLIDVPDIVYYCSLSFGILLSILIGNDIFLTATLFFLGTDLILIGVIGILNKRIANEKPSN